MGHLSIKRRKFLNGKRPFLPKLAILNAGVFVVRLLGLPKSIVELFGKRKNNVARLRFALAQTVVSEVCFDAP